MARGASSPHSGDFQLPPEATENSAAISHGFLGAVPPRTHFPGLSVAAIQPARQHRNLRAESSIIRVAVRRIRGWE